MLNSLKKRDDGAEETSGNVRNSASTGTTDTDVRAQGYTAPKEQTVTGATNANSVTASGSSTDDFEFNVQKPTSLSDELL